MVLQIGVEHHLVYEARSIFHTSGIGCGIGTVEGEVEVEVLELLSAFIILGAEEAVGYAELVLSLHLPSWPPLVVNILFAPF